MKAKTWFVDPNDDGTADVYRGDTSAPVQTVECDSDADAAALKAMDAEVEKELPEAADAGEQGGSFGLSQRGGEILKEMAVGDIVVGPPPVARE